MIARKLRQFFIGLSVGIVYPARSGLRWPQPTPPHFSNPSTPDVDQQVGDNLTPADWERFMRDKYGIANPMDYS